MSLRWFLKVLLKKLKLQLKALKLAYVSAQRGSSVAQISIRCSKVVDKSGNKGLQSLAVTSGMMCQLLGLWETSVVECCKSQLRSKKQWNTAELHQVNHAYPRASYGKEKGCSRVCTCEMEKAWWLKHRSSNSPTAITLHVFSLNLEVKKQKNKKSDPEQFSQIPTSSFFTYSEVKIAVD